MHSTESTITSRVQSIGSASTGSSTFESALSSTTSSASATQVTVEDTELDAELDDENTSVDAEDVEIEDTELEEELDLTLEDIVSRLEELEISDYLSDETLAAIAEIVLQYCEGEQINLEDMTDSELIEYIMTEAVDLLTVDEYYTLLEVTSGIYGVDQGVFNGLEELDPEAYEEIRDYFMEYYNISEETAETLMALIGLTDDNSYALAVTSIIDAFKDNPEGFEEIFGFSLYTETESGQLVLNDKQLLFDLYFWANSQGEGATLISIDESGNVVLNLSEYNLTEGSSFVNQVEINETNLNAYLQSKDSTISYAEQVAFDSTEEYDVSQITEKLNELLENGGSISIEITTDGAINLMDTEGELAEIFSGTTNVQLTGLTEDGIEVSYGGEKCVISFDDLIDKSESYSVSNSTISFSETTEEATINVES